MRLLLDCYSLSYCLFFFCSVFRSNLLSEATSSRFLQGFFYVIKLHQCLKLGRAGYMYFLRHFTNVPVIQWISIIDVCYICISYLFCYKWGCWFSILIFFHACYTLWILLIVDDRRVTNSCLNPSQIAFNDTRSYSQSDVPHRVNLKWGTS